MPSYSQIQQALTACMKAEPPVDFALSKDSSQLAAVFAEMMFDGQAERPLEALTPKQRAAFERWQPGIVTAAPVG